MSDTHIPSGAAPAHYDGPKRALVLSGGGVRLSYQSGAIKALFDHGLVFHHMDATSGGSLNMSMLLAGLTPEECCERWRTQCPNDFTGFMAIKDYLDPANLTAMGSADGVVDKVFPHLGIKADKIRQATGITGTYNVLNFNNKNVDILEHTEITTEMIVAGMSLPGVMPPVVTDGTSHLDTAFSQDANPWLAARRGAEEIWLVWGLGNTPTFHGGGLRIYIQMLEMAANCSLTIQFERIAELNERIARGDSPYGQKNPIRLHVIRPEYPLPLDPDLIVGKIDHATLINMGYDDTRKYLAGMKPEGLKPSYKLTQQKEPGLGVRFREVMSGGFALGTTDPGKGAKQGAKEDSEFAIHATIDIRDIDKFTVDPEHRGTLTGRIDFTPFGKDILGYNGVFNLFSPTDDPKTKLMVYELGFTHEGKNYYFAGRKEVKDHPGFDVWADTTTLFSLLYEGEDKTGKVIGAGTLRLSLGQLKKMVGTFTATNATGVGESVKALAKFGKLFLGSAWSTYAGLAGGD